MMKGLGGATKCRAFTPNYATRGIALNRKEGRAGYAAARHPGSGAPAARSGHGACLPSELVAARGPLSISFHFQLSPSKGLVKAGGSPLENPHAKQLGSINAFSVTHDAAVTWHGN